MLDVAKPSSIKEAHSFTSPSSFLLFGVKYRILCRHASASLSRLYESIETRNFLVYSCSKISYARCIAVLLVKSLSVIIA